MDVLINKKVGRFIAVLQRGTIAKVLRVIDLLEEFGYNIPMPYSRKIKPNLYELRARGEQEIRIFYTLRNNQAILLHAFVKKTNKAPIREIETALARLKSIDQ
jgi:phage-related protein